MGSESKNNGEVMHIPAASKKVVQRIKEFVNKNCTDSEIYSVLCECNMDADTAVQELISQDTFHQVKSKRERRKEVRETHESKAWSNHNGYRGVKIGGEYNVGRLSSQIGSNDLGKAAYRKENGSVAPSSTLIYRVKATNELPSPCNNSCNDNDRRQDAGTGDTITSSIQQFSMIRAGWSGGTSGHISMADIVRMGRPSYKGSQIMTETSCYTAEDADSVNSSQHCRKAPCDCSTFSQEMHQGLKGPHPSQVSENIYESGVTDSQHGFQDEWPGVEQQAAASGSSTFNLSSASNTDMFANQSFFLSDETKLSEDCQLEEVQVSESDGDNKNPGSYCAESAFPYIRQENLNSAVGHSHCSTSSFKDMKSYDSRRQINEHQEETGSGVHLLFVNDGAPMNDEVSLAAVNMQQLSLGKEPTVPPSQHDHAVVFPDYLQDLAADCSHLSFGTYKSGGLNAVSGPLASAPLKNLEEASAAINGSSALCREIRNSEHLWEEQLGSMPDAHRLSAAVGNLEMSTFSKPELTRHIIPEASLGHEFIHPSPLPDSDCRKTQELGSPLGVNMQPKSRSSAPLYEELQASSTTLPLDLFASTIKSSRDSDHAQSFLGTQSLLSRFGSNVSSTGNPAISQSEILSSSAFSLPVSILPPLSGASITPLPALPQHLSANLYSQPSVSLEELTDLSAYPAMPQNYACNPSAFQQVYQDGSMFYDASMGYSRPQYKTVTSRINLPLADGNISGYGGFGSATNFPGGILQSGVRTGSAGGYDILQPQYQERDNISSLQQNDSSSRMMSSFPDNRCFSFQGESHLFSKYPQVQHFSQDYSALIHSNNYQQSQQLPQDFGALLHANANAYHYRAGIPQEQQHQSLEDLSVSSSQGSATQQLHKLW